MPLYDYQCKQCQTIFEIQATIKEKKAGLNPLCPKCSSENTRQMLTAGLMLHSSSDSKNSGGCNPGSGCCG